MRKPLVLVVEDDVALCSFVGVAFELEGFRVCLAHGVIEAEKHVAEHLPDAIVLDVDLPVIDGLTYCRRLREQARTRDLPVVMISGYETRERAQRAGANGFALKPFDPFELVGLLGRLLAPAASAALARAAA